MPTYNYLPGTIVNIQDGGLTSQFAPQDDAILVIGTAGQGVCGSPYQVIDRSLSALEFGFLGSLERSIEECVTNSDNVVAYRMGAKPMVLSGVGLDTTVDAGTPGFNITFTDATATSATDYQIWYTGGVLSVWENGELQYSNEDGTTVDTGNIVLSAPVAGNVGLPLVLAGGPDTPSLAYAVTITAAVALTGTTFQEPPTLTQEAVTGLNMTGRQKYIALRQALEMLSGISAKVVYCADAQFDQPNVAFYNAAATIGSGLGAYNPTANNNPVTNPDALDWLKVTKDPYGDNIYQWGNDVLDSAGNTVTTMLAQITAANAGVTTLAGATAAMRQGVGFMEVNFGSTLGNFCADLSEIGPLSVAVIGCSQPLSANLVNTRKWVGFLPTYDNNGNPSASGMGLLGNPYLMGCHVESLNNLCADYGSGYRLPGLYVTQDESYDGEPQIDGNGNVEDAGKFLHVVADWAFMSNGWAINYVQNIAGLVAGYLSSLDPASGLTNKAVQATQIWQPTPVQMDALTEAKINVLRFKGINNQPVLLHDLTAARDVSDYTNLVRVRCFSLVIATLLTRANGYIGESSLDGLTLVAMKTQLDQDLVNLTTRGYCNHSNVTISSSTVQQKIGHATLNLVVHPADELIQLTANVGVGT